MMAEEMETRAKALLQNARAVRKHAKRVEDEFGCGNYEIET